MSVGESKVAIYAAMAANLAIAIAKFIGAAITGSSAMLSEGIHSIVDTVNEVLLLYGLNRSQRSPDEDHPLGYGQELYFWSLIVAVLIFALGGGVSVYEGVKSIQHPEPAANVLVSYGVLGAAALFEGAALAVSLRSFQQSQTQPQSLWSALRQSKDPSAFVVIVEDGAALVGLLFAFGGVFLSERTGNSVYDGMASIAIGILLTIVAIALVGETKGLLIGESAAPAIRENIRAIVQADAAVSKLDAPITLHLGPQDIMVAMHIEFQDALSADEIEAATRRIERKIREAHGEVKRIFLEAASIVS
ncbi:MAG: cation diffusion facilitator family transporter [Spirulina sp. SIO3F2]|nr:cation diffusion facilitator family transporter [Spirulina sp. SIO3F2]